MGKIRHLAMAVGAITCVGSLLATQASADTTPPTGSRDCVDYEPVEITLQGIVKTTTVYIQLNDSQVGKDPHLQAKGQKQQKEANGKNNGMKEKRKQFAVLYLDKPICIVSGRADEYGFADVKSIQLFPPPGKYFNPDLMNIHVAVTGTLWPRGATDAVTDVVLVYTSANQSPDLSRQMLSQNRP